MVDERTLVIADLLVRLAEVGINPDRPWSATWIPGAGGWAFAQEPENPKPPSGSSSSSSGGSAKVER